jgi:hypothetical protein
MPEEQQTRFKLRRLRDGTVKLMAVNENGDLLASGNILAIAPDGRLELFGGVSRHLGLQLDGHRRVVISPHTR